MPPTTISPPPRIRQLRELPQERSPLLTTSNPSTLHYNSSLLERTYGKTDRVDHENCVIYGVKVLGRFSRNTHKEPGAESSEYTEQCLRDAIPLYEGLGFNCNHVPRHDPDKEYSVYDGPGELRAVRVKWGSSNPEDDGLVADLHLLRSHPFTATLMEAAEKMPNRFGLSHNADGAGRVIKSRYYIEKITRVRSVDIVNKPATTRGLFEDEENSTVAQNQTVPVLKLERKLPKTLKAIFESRTLGQLNKDPRWNKIRNLVEGDYGSLMMEDPITTGDNGEEVECCYEDHLASMLSALVKDPRLTPQEKVAKGTFIIKLLDEGAATGEEGGEGESNFIINDKNGKGQEGEEGEEVDEGEEGSSSGSEESSSGSGSSSGSSDKGKPFDKSKGSGTGDKKPDPKKKKDTNMAESKELLELRASKNLLESENKQLKTTQKVQELCTAKKHTPTANQLKVLCLLESDEERNALIDDFVKAATSSTTPPPPTNKVKTSGGSRSLVESEEDRKGRNATKDAAFTGQTDLKKKVSMLR